MHQIMHKLLQKNPHVLRCEVTTIALPWHSECALHVQGEQTLFVALLPRGAVCNSANGGKNSGELEHGGAVG